MTEQCSIRYALYILGGKWKFRIIWILSQNKAVRYNELKRHLKGISNIMLTQSLQELTEHMIVRREQYNEVPPRVEYSLTELGEELMPALQDMAAWAIRVKHLNGMPFDMFKDDDEEACSG